MSKIVTTLVSVLCLIFVSAASYAQEQVWPGAVSKPVLWLQASDGKLENKTSFQDLTVKSQQLAGGKYNFNESVLFDAKKDSILALFDETDKKRFTLFMAYKVKESLKEQLLWSVSNEGKTVSVATNLRLANLLKYRYKSYSRAVLPNKANIHYYQQNITDSLPTKSYLKLGSSNKEDRLPVPGFLGELSEVLFYDRVLSGFETQKIISYLAIKYGISIADIQPNNYLNSQGNVIWDISEHKGFISNITAVGRDDESGLLQLMSTNSLNEGLLTMGLKSETASIPDKYFTFWSDNGKNLILGKQDQGEPIGFSRAWELDFYNPSDIYLDGRFSTSFFKGELPADTYYWLLIDYSGLGTYTFADSEYIKLGKAKGAKGLSLSNFNWDKRKTGKVHFKIKVAPSLFSRVAIEESTCGVPSSGSLNFKVLGGSGPFTITVTNKDTEKVVKQWVQSAESDVKVSVSSGKYLYVIRDQQGAVYSDEVFVSDKNAIQAELDTSYILQSGDALYLDAEKSLPPGLYQYEWYFEGNFIDDTSSILVRMPGEYELRVRDRNNCQSSQKISVGTDGSTSPFAPKLILFPNPTTDGNYTLSMDYPEKTDVRIRLYTAHGAFLGEERYTGVTTDLHRGHISGAAGMYIIHVQSNDFGTHVFKVIVK